MDKFQDKQPVIVHEEYGRQSLITIDTSKKVLQNSKGTFLMTDLLNTSSGQQISNNKNTNNITILCPTPTLVTDTICHKTQIIYHMDIAQIIQQLGLCNGKVVVESGTGSASLTYSLAQAIGRAGQLHTFEFNQERDVYEHGFTCTVNHNTYEQNYADAVFLDLPKPFDAISHAKKILKRNGRVCCFSPCIEQVQKNCLVLKKEGFINIITIESLQRTFQVMQKDIFGKYNQKQEQKKENHQEEEQIQQEKEEKEENEQQQQQQNNYDGKAQKRVKCEFGSFGPTRMKGHTGYLTFAVLY